MTSTEAMASNGSRAVRSASPARLFHSGAAALLLLLMFLGFRQFYVHGRAYPDRDLTPPIRTLLVLHGLGMTAWMVLSVVQPLLIAGRRHRVHMSLGMVGAALAAVIVLLGWKVGIEATRVDPPELRIWGLSPRQFMIVPIVSVTIFAGFVAAGVLARRRPDVHRPMMLLASLAVMPAAISRIDFLNSLYVGTMWESLLGPFFMTLVVGAVLLAVRCLLARSFDRWFAAGYAVLAVSSVLMVQMATTGAWDRFAGFLLG
jgi:hypothetical protein